MEKEMSKKSQREKAMDRINEWFWFELKGNLKAAFWTTLAFQLMFFRRKFLAVQGLGLGLASGVTFYHAEENMKNLDSDQSRSIVNAKRFDYLAFFLTQVGVYRPLYKPSIRFEETEDRRQRGQTWRAKWLLKRIELMQIKYF